MATAKGGKKGEYYVGQGKWIKDQDGLGNSDTRMVAETGRDAVVGGFAGGEKRLQQYRQELNEAGAQEKVKKGTKPRKETQDVVLAKDFNSAAGGIFFGEVGLQSWKETGRIPTRSKEATLGWGPPVLLAVVALAGVTYKTTGALSVDAVTKTVESVGSGATSIDVSDVVAKVGGAVGALRESCGYGEENGWRFRENRVVGHRHLDDCEADFALMILHPPPKPLSAYNNTQYT
jgi:hypothetical protein